MSRKKSYFVNIAGVPGRIRNIRGGLTQSGFAKILGVTQGTVQKYEAGTTLPGDGILIKIADYGGVAVEWLLRGEEMVSEASQLREHAPEDESRPASIDRDALAHIILLVRDWLRRKKERFSAPAEAEMISRCYDFWLEGFVFPDDQDIAALRRLINN